jgi:hypothetical protein
MGNVATVMAPSPSETSDRLEPGARVEVLQRFESRWARGFEIVEAVDAGYRVRRRSDNAELPAVFAAADVRRERRRDTWWY